LATEETEVYQRETEGFFTAKGHKGISNHRGNRGLPEGNRGIFYRKGRRGFVKNVKELNHFRKSPVNFG
jgi:hypothetical protein